MIKKLKAVNKQVVKIIEEEMVGLKLSRNGNEVVVGRKSIGYNKKTDCGAWIIYSYKMFVRNNFCELDSTYNERRKKLEERVKELLKDYKVLINYGCKYIGNTSRLEYSDFIKLLEIVVIK